MRTAELHVFELIADPGPTAVLAYGKDIRPMDFAEATYNGHSLPENWTPPPLRLVGGRKLPICDFLRGDRSNPFLSNRAAKLLRPLMADDVQLIPVDRRHLVDHYWMVVTRMVQALDLERSRLDYSPDRPGVVIGHRGLVFDVHKLDGISIFKIPQLPYFTFVTQPFLQAVKVHRLTGVALLDPTHDPLDCLVAGPRPVFGPILPQT